MSSNEGYRYMFTPMEEADRPKPVSYCGRGNGLYPVEGAVASLDLTPEQEEQLDDDLKDLRLKAQKSDRMRVRKG